MLEYHFIELGVVYLTAIMIPGPSISLIIKNGITSSRTASILTTIGIILAIAFQSGIVLLGLGFLNLDNSFIHNIKIFCSLFLIYLGIKLIFCKCTNDNVSQLVSTKTYYQYFFEGFMIEFLNPIAFTFFISITALVVPENELCYIKFIYWVELIVIGTIWFFTVSFFLSLNKINNYTRKFRKVIDPIAGLIFILFAIKYWI